MDHVKYPGVAARYRFEEVEDRETAEELPKEQPAAEKAQVFVNAAPEDSTLDPLVEAFLDAKNMQEKLDALTALRPRITNDMIDTMAVAAGLEIGPGEVQNTSRRAAGSAEIRRNEICRVCLQAVCMAAQRNNKLERLKYEITIDLCTLLQLGSIYG